MSTLINLSSFDNIYNETYHDVLKYIICKCSNIEDANDILQDVYLEFYKIINKKESFMLDNYNAFLIGIAKNKVKQYFTLKYKITSLIAYSNDDEENTSDIASDINLESIILTNDDIDQIRNFVKTKQSVVQKIFYLYYYYDMPLKEIAMEINMKESTVKSHLYRLVKELNDVFRKEDHHE